MTASDMQQQPVVYIGLGANLGDPIKALREAVRRIMRYSSAGGVVCSSLYRTAPVDSSGPDYVNAVLRLHTALNPENLLAILQRVENELGRIRPIGTHNAPRTMDCDLLMYADMTMSTARLILPHPRMHLRAFVLVPLLEIEPNLQIPGLGSARNYLKNVQDQLIQRLDCQIGE